MPLSPNAKRSLSPADAGTTGVISFMINFEEELKKFHPSLEIEELETTIYNQDLTDMADLMVEMVKESQETLQAEGTDQA